MTMNLSSPFARALVSEGQRRGYPMMSIAASLGNAFQENGLRTSGAPGDGGSAFGGFQWRNERKTALDGLAARMGRPWDDPAVQARHWYDEQDGSESRWGLKGARDVEQATSAAVSSLRPMGWSAGNPQASHAYGNRLRATEEAYNILSGGQGAGLPEPDSTGSIGNPTASTQSKGTSSALTGFTDFLEGGPGALFGLPQEGWNLGDAVGGMGIAAMARDNPKGAAHLVEYLRSGQKSAGQVTTDIDHRTGRAYQYDGRGNVTYHQLHAPEAAPTTQQYVSRTGEMVTLDQAGNVTNKAKIADIPPKPIGDGARKMFQENGDRADIAFKAIEDNNRFIDMLMSGRVNLSAKGRLGNEYHNFINESDEGSRNAALFRQHIENLRNARLLEAKGVQTEGDAERALSALLPGNARYDNKAVVALLRGLNTDFTNSFETRSRYNASLIKRYKDDLDPEDFYKGRYDERMTSLRASSDAFDKRMPEFLAPKPAPAPVPLPTTTIPNGRDPMRRGSSQRGSFLDFYNRSEAEDRARSQARPSDLELPSGP